MAMDLTITEYETFDDLLVLHGRLRRGDRRDDAADPRAEAHRRRRRTLATSASPSSSRTSCATSWRTSIAAACTSLRRISSSFGADPHLRRADPEWRALMAFEIARTRDVLRVGRPGRADAPRRRRLAASALLGACTARSSSGSSAQGYDVFSTRARVPTARKLAVVGRELRSADGADRPASVVHGALRLRARRDHAERPAARKP